MKRILDKSPLVDIQAVLKSYKEKIETEIQALTIEFGSSSELSLSCQYAMTTGGKRYRPILVLMIANALGNGANVIDAALATEFFHTASLIADDLPCMDNDDQRRNKPAVHKVYGEAVALLASYTLIASGYEYIARNARKNNAEHLCLLALENVTYNAGIKGATTGQFLDLFPPDLSLDTMRQAIHKKTVALFEICFVLGWLFGGGEVSKVELVKKAASCFGMAFQVVDDLDDTAQDKRNERQVNMAAVCGKEKALEMFHEEIQSYKSVLNQLSIASPEMLALADLLISRAELFS